MHLLIRGCGIRCVPSYSSSWSSILVIGIHSKLSSVLVTAYPIVFIGSICQVIENRVFLALTRTALDFLESEKLMNLPRHIDEEIL